MPKLINDNKNVQTLIAWTLTQSKIFKNFKQDEERKCFLHLKKKSIQAFILIQGTKL